MLRLAGVRACCVLLLWSGNVTAQERMEILVADPSGALRNQAMLELDVSESGFGAVRHVTPVPFLGEIIYSTPAALVGGRYLTWINGGRSGADPRFLQVFDRQSRRYAIASATANFDVLPDPKRPRVFSKTPITPASPGDVYVFDLATQGSRAISLGGVPGFGGPFVSVLAYAADADLMFGFRGALTGSTFTYDVVAADVATGAIGRQFPVADSSGLLLTDRNAASVYLAAGAFLGTGPIVRYDAVSGLAAASSTALSVTSAVLDEARGRLLVTTLSPPSLLVLDALTLSVLTTIPVSPPVNSIAVRVGRGHTGAYLMRAAARTSGGCTFSVTAFDETLTPRNAVGVDADAGLLPIYCSAGLVTLVSQPDAPERLAATVTDRRVDLSWRNPGDTTSFEIEVGYAPGATALRLPMGMSLFTASDNTPPGTYYVRVVAVNDVGRSLPSNEVRVDVH